MLFDATLQSWPLQTSVASASNTVCRVMYAVLLRMKQSIEIDLRNITGSKIYNLKCNYNRKLNFDRHHSEPIFDDPQNSVTVVNPLCARLTWRAEIQKHFLGQNHVTTKTGLRVVQVKNMGHFEFKHCHIDIRRFQNSGINIMPTFGAAKLIRNFKFVRFCFCLSVRS